MSREQGPYHLPYRTTAEAQGKTPTILRPRRNRNLIRGIGEIAVGLSLVTGLGAGFVYFGSKVEPNDGVCRENVGRQVPGKSEALYETDLWGGNESVPLRSAATQGDSIKGVTDSDIQVEARQVYGSVYTNSDFDNLPDSVDVNGERCGIWYEVADVPLYEPVGESGGLVPLVDKSGNIRTVDKAYLSGNYLVPADVSSELPNER